VPATPLLHHQTARKLRTNGDKGHASNSMLPVSGNFLHPAFVDRNQANSFPEKITHKVALDRRTSSQAKRGNLIRILAIGKEQCKMVLVGSFCRKPASGTSHRTSILVVNKHGTPRCHGWIFTEPPLKLDTWALEGVCVSILAFLKQAGVYGLVLHSRKEEMS